MKKKFFKYFLAITAILSLVVLANNHQVKAASYNKSEMRLFVRKTIAKYQARGSVVVIKDGHAQQISYGYGFYGRKLGNGNNKVIYPVCSLQKIMTGAIIQQLIDKKKFSADTPISRWYPSIKNSKNIKVGNLLTHTSGIVMSGTETKRHIIYSELGAIDWVLNQVNLRSENNPGHFSYNNTNFILLAGIIRKETGKSYATNVNERIIKPLKLKNTFIGTQIPKNKIRAISYTWNVHNYQKPQTASIQQTSQLPGAANIYTTPKDYYKIQLGLTNGKILKKKQFDQLTHLKYRTNSYSGGVYIKKKDKLKMAYGNLHGTHFGNWFQMTSDNKNGLVMFLSQTQNDENRNKDIGYEILNHIKPNAFSNR